MNELDTYRPLPFYFINTHEPEALSANVAEEAMAHLQEAGYGGCIFFNKPPTGFEPDGFLSDAWFKAVGHFAQAARARRMQLWINDGFDFPPGDAGGRIAAVAPELSQWRLHRDAEGRIVPVEVPWGFPAFEEPESSRLFIQFGYEEYYRRFAPYFGDGISGFFSDADNRRFNHHVRKLIGDEPYFPWSREFGRLFQERYGYPLESRFAELWDGRNPQLNRDYWLLAGDLYQQWFRNNHEWCRAHGVLYSFHTSDTGPFSRHECDRSSLYTEGLPLALLSHSDCPGTDHELACLDSGTHYTLARLFTPMATLGQPPDDAFGHPAFAATADDLRAKYAASAAWLDGHRRALCELFAATGWSADFTLLRRIAAWQIMQGINLLVPHAVHHRLFGVTKYFAPPEFLQGSLRHGLREFNDWLAFACRAAADGEYADPVGVLDPSEEILAGKAEGAAVHRLCDRLNRRCVNYVVTDHARANRFKTLLEPLTGEEELPPPLATFDGGELAWMHRRLADGTGYLLVANLWAEKELRGTVVWGARHWQIALQPGEIAILGGPYESYRATNGPCVPGEALAPTHVRRLDANVVPLWTLREWQIAEELCDGALSLLVPAAMAGKVLCDGVRLADGEPCRVFDDDYRRFALAGTVGQHRLRCLEEPPFETPLLLEGDFAAGLLSEGTSGENLYGYYGLTIRKPQRMELSLAPAATRPLAMGDWCRQGLPFYSGELLYRFEVEGNGRNAVLQMDIPGGACRVSLDGAPATRLLWAPWHVDLGTLPRGRHTLDVIVANTSGNRMDGILFPSGLHAARLVRQ